MFQAIFDLIANYQGKISTRKNSTRTQAIFQAIFYSLTNYQDKIYARLCQRDPKLSSYIRFNCQLSRQDLCSCNSVRTKALFQAY